MSRTLPRPRSFSPGKSVCEMMALICGEDMECFSSLEAGILAQHVRMSTLKESFCGDYLGSGLRASIVVQLPRTLHLHSNRIRFDTNFLDSGGNVGQRD